MEIRRNMKKLIPLLIILVAFSVTVFPAYSQVISCHDKRVIHIIQLDGILECLENRIVILENAPSGSESTDCINLGTQYQIIVNSTNGDCFVRSLSNGTGITLSVNSTHIRINSTSGSGETTICSNLGSIGEGIVATSSGGNCDFKKLFAGTNDGITLSSNGTRITIENDTVCTNAGTGVPLCNSGADASVVLDSLIAGTGIIITDTTNDWTISVNPNSDRQIGQVAGQVFFSLAKSNIGTAYVDVYATAFDEENQMIIECANVTYGKVVYQWDYVGTGTQQLRWVDVSNNANVWYESPTFTTDRDGIDSGFFVKPSWCIGTVTIEEQGKSTVAGDDPVAKGYKIMVK